MAKKSPVVDIGKIDDLDVLVSHLCDDRDPARRLDIVSQLRKRKDVTPDMVTELGRLAWREDSAPVQTAFARTIATIGGPTAIEALGIIFRHPRSPEARQTAAYGMSALKTSAARTASPEEVTRRLMGMLRIGGAWQDRLEALELLQERGISQKTALEIARNADAETTGFVQRPMLAVIVEHVGTAALPTLQQLAKSPNWAGVREEVKSEITTFKSRIRDQTRASAKQVLTLPNKTQQPTPQTGV